MEHYVKCPKILNTFIFKFSNKMLFIRAGIHKMLVGIANREDPDYTDLDLTLFGKQVVFEII